MARVLKNHHHRAIELSLRERDWKLLNPRERSYKLLKHLESIMHPVDFMRLTMLLTEREGSVFRLEAYEYLLRRAAEEKRKKEYKEKGIHYNPDWGFRQGEGNP